MSLLTIHFCFVDAGDEEYPKRPASVCSVENEEKDTEVQNTENDSTQSKTTATEDDSTTCTKTAADQCDVTTEINAENIEPDTSKDEIGVAEAESCADETKESEDMKDPVPEASCDSETPTSKDEADPSDTTKTDLEETEACVEEKDTTPDCSINPEPSSPGSEV